MRLRKLFLSLVVCVISFGACAAPSSPPATAPPTPTPTFASLILHVGGSGQYQSIQQAINSAPSGATIKVAQGTYTENIIIKSSKNIQLEGGWNADFSSRSDDSALTVLDGGGHGSVLDIGVSNGINVILRIDAFTIKNGTSWQGGGVRVVAGRGAKIALLLHNNVIMGNSSTNRGGGIFIESAGGSIDATVTNSIITKNVTNNEGGGIRVNSCDGGTVVVTLTKNVITSNAVTHLVEGEGGWDGGGIAAFASRSGATTLTLTNNVITKNEAGWGGGVFGYAWGPDAALSITLTNNVIAGNRAGGCGAGIFSCSGQTCPVSEPGGSVIWTLTNNTVTGNIANDGGSGIHIVSGSGFGDGGLISLSMQNDIVWGNTDPHGGQQLVVGVAVGRSGVATAKASYSDVGFSIATHGGGAYTLDHMINTDPLFADPVNQVFLLQDGSPCIDVGDPSSTCNDGSCPPGKGTERCDMGAYGGPNNYDWPK